MIDPHPATLLRHVAGSLQWPYEIQFTLRQPGHGPLELTWLVAFPQQFSGYAGPGLCVIPADMDQDEQTNALGTIVREVHDKVLAEAERVGWAQEVARQMKVRLPDPKFRAYIEALRQQDGENVTYMDMTIEQSQRWLERINQYSA